MAKEEKKVNKVREELVKASKIKIYANPEEPSDIVNLEIEKTKEFKAEDLQEDVTSLIEETITSQVEQTETDEKIKPASEKKSFFFKKKKEKKEELDEPTQQEVVVEQEVVEEIEEDFSDEEIKDYIENLFYSNNES